MTSNIAGRWLAVSPIGIIHKRNLWSLPIGEMANQRRATATGKKDSTFKLWASSPQLVNVDSIRQVELPDDGLSWTNKLKNNVSTSLFSSSSQFKEKSDSNNNRTESLLFSRTSITSSWAKTARPALLCKPSSYPNMQSSSSQHKDK